MADHDSSAPTLGTELKAQLQQLLAGGQAHVTFEDVVKNLPPGLRGVVPENLPHSAWQILEHIRIAQRDILEFSSNADGSYKPLKWPDEYWPTNPNPPAPEHWEKSVQHVVQDRKAFGALLEAAEDAALTAPFPWGDGQQSLLREALLIADHTAYHTGELVFLRRVLGAWNK